MFETTCPQPAHALQKRVITFPTKEIQNRPYLDFWYFNYPLPLVKLLAKVYPSCFLPLLPLTAESPSVYWVLIFSEMNKYIKPFSSVL